MCDCVDVSVICLCESVCVLVCQKEGGHFTAILRDQLNIDCNKVSESEPTT